MIACICGHEHQEGAPCRGALCMCGGAHEGFFRSDLRNIAEWLENHGEGDTPYESLKRALSLLAGEFNDTAVRRMQAAEELARKAEFTDEFNMLAGGC